MGGILSSVLKVYNYYKQSPIEGTLYILQSEYPHISGDIKIIRDKNGVAHIYAENTDDIWFGQGFVVAQERLVAMDIRRRIAKGTLSKVLPEALTIDRVSRTLGFYRVAKFDHDNNVTKETMKTLVSFTNGMNYYLKSKYYKYPVEVVLGYPAPEEFTIIEIGAIMRMICWQMSRGFMGKIVGVAVKQMFGEKTNEFDYNTLSKINFEKFKKLFESFPPQNQGSNSFCVSGKYTKSGKPILENDCHLLINSPSTWLEFHFVCKEFDAYGFNLVGLIGIQSGFNKDIAFGVTLSYCEGIDVYIQKINPKNENQYLYDGKWRDFKIITEEIEVKGRREKVVEKIRFTENNGVLFSDILKFQVDEKPKYQYSVRSVCLEKLKDNKIFNIFKICFCKSVEEFRACAQNCKTVGANFCVADQKGNIGIVVIGAVPKRSEDALQFAGSTLPGWNSKYTWDGFQEKGISLVNFTDFNFFKKINPKRGYVIACNHDFFSHFKIPRPYFFSQIFLPPQRALRIEQLLRNLIESEKKITVDDMLKVSNDSTQYDVSFVVNMFKTIIIGDEDPILFEALRIISKFKGEFSVESVGASIYVVFFDEIATDLLARIGIKSPSLMLRFLCGGGFSSKFLPVNEYKDVCYVIIEKLLAKYEKKERVKIILKNLKKSIEFLEKKIPECLSFKNNPKKYLSCFKYGKIHTITWKHPLGEKGLVGFNRGPYPSFGNYNTPFMGGYNRMERHDYSTIYIPTMKIIVDLNDLDNAKSAQWPGQSCNIGSKWFDDGIPHFLNGTLRNVYFSKENVEKNKLGTIDIKGKK